jgi:hypothetical protein
VSSFVRFWEALRGPGWPVALIGAMALAAWDIPRATSDLDWLVGAPSRRAFEELAQRLVMAGFLVRHRTSEWGDPLGDVIEATGEDCQYQCILAIHDHERRALARAVPLAVMDTAVPVVTIEDLVILKCYANGPQDWLDIQRLLECHREGMDVAYLRSCLADPVLKDCSTRLLSLLAEGGPPGP